MKITRKHRREILYGILLAALAVAVYWLLVLAADWAGVGQ